MALPFATKPYHSAFRLLARDLQRVLEYVEPTDVNGPTYSHRIYELQLRVCTETESLWRDMVLASSWNKKKAAILNGSDYRRLEADWNSSRFTVSLLFWKPKPRLVVPFVAWKRKGAPLPWYRDYNTVKHNRNSEFPRANLASLTDAFAGLFLMLARVDGDGFEAGYTMHGPNHWHVRNDEFDMRCDGKAGWEVLQ